MANLVETSTFDAGIYRIETSDPVQGGETGIANKPLKALANRTIWLRDTLAGVSTFIATLKSAATKEFSNTPAADKVATWNNLYSKDEVDTKVAAGAQGDHHQLTGVSLITGGGAEANMADMSVTFNPKGSKILVMFSAPFHSSVTTQGLTCYINVGGVNVASQTATIYQQDLVFSFQFMVDVSTGVATTAKIRWNANSNITQNGVASPRILTVLDLM